MVLLGTGGALAGGHIVTQAEKLGIYAGMPLLGRGSAHMVEGSRTWLVHPAVAALQLLEADWVSDDTMQRALSRPAFAACSRSLVSG